VRAAESAREDRLFEDPWAAALAGAEGRAWIKDRPATSTVVIALRTRYFDDFLRNVVDHEAIRQVVLVAAGLDTRAFRLAWPEGTQLYEIDQPAVLQHKDEVLRAAGAVAACTRHAVRQDLAGPWADGLRAAGFDPGRPSLWLAEGLLFYLADDDGARLLDEVTRLAAPGSRLGFDAINTETFRSPYTRPWVEMQAQLGAPWIGTMDDPVGALAARGWQATLSQAGAVEAHHGRWPFPTIPVTMPGLPHHWFVSARRTGA
jgi:methyltransferase (TIGR00027 family)